MTLGLLVVGAMLLAFPALGVRAPGTRSPGEWSRVVFGALVVGAATIELGLLLTAVPTVLGWLRFEGVPGVCHAVVDQLMVGSGGPVMGWTSLLLAILLLVVLLVSGGRSHVLAARVRVDPWIGVHEHRGAYELVFVPLPSLLALSVPGSEPQIIVSEGVVEHLTARDLEALIAHEAAHLRLSHRRYLLIARTIARAFAVVPFARRSASVLGAAVEEWADEEATGGVPSRRRDLCSALGALAAAQPNGSVVDVAAERIGRLESTGARPAPSWRALLYAPAMALSGLSLILLGGWLRLSHHLLALSASCPS